MKDVIKKLAQIRRGGKIHIATESTALAHYYWVCLLRTSIWEHWLILQGYDPSKITCKKCLKELRRSNQSEN
jgi:hypothetical protein